MTSASRKRPGSAPGGRQCGTECSDIPACPEGGDEGPARDIVLMNAGGAAICIGGRAHSPEQGIRCAEAAIDSGGRAQEKLDALVKMTGGELHYDT